MSDLIELIVMPLVIGLIILALKLKCEYDAKKVIDDFNKEK